MGLLMDALSAIKIIKRAGSGKLAYVRRTVGMSIMWLHERYIESSNSWVAHQPGKDLTADAGTKAVNEETFARHTARMGMSG